VGAVEIAVDPRRLPGRVLAVCLVAEIALVVLDYHVSYGRLTEIGAIRRLFNATREDGLASWFSVTQTAFVAFTLWLVALTQRWRGADRWRVRGWLVLAAFFVWMAVDDGAKVHERVGTATRVLADRGSSVGLLLTVFPSYAWQVLFVPIFGALGLFMLVFLWRQLEDATGRALLVAGIGLLVLAVGMDFCEGLSRQHPWNPYQWLAGYPEVGAFTRARFQRPPYDALVHFSKSLEEFAEMLGNTLLWAAVLREWARTTAGLRIRFAG
jgi:hypothetical protein